MNEPKQTGAPKAVESKPNAKLQLVSVNSSNIHSIGFHDEALYIKFRNGNTYKYTGPKVAEHHKGIMAAESKGGFFGKNIRRCGETTCVKHEEPIEEAEPNAETDERNFGGKGADTPL